MVASQAFNAAGQPLKSALISFARTPLLLLLLAGLGSYLGGVAGVFIGITLANLVAGGLAYWMTRALCRGEPDAPSPLDPRPAPSTASG